MNELKPYLCTALAFRDPQISIFPWLISAYNAEDAEQKLDALTKERWPPVDGWRINKMVVIQESSEGMIEFAEQLKKSAKVLSDSIKAAEETESVLDSDLLL